ncbi:hypothetical protein PUNSTDRAFT_142552 [Punctularia strigosozonata HHB-11173 SS5]|uniref:uncharacterized protein n=1 Tax=Punctularia strigosozonata (strain HHB-11173) TaxID=741275 RepID=UPI0004417B59|nr:uncharacterized protein PUNSTDRAFT_142552 [Punctularia strigosozonata HHB-11173 SS5]EIN10571.1 hypothetical protein PUNSTDRAFT_142552 [Punctularia strigosozonata HHB-11173 SS5]
MPTTQPNCTSRMDTSFSTAVSTAFLKAPNVVPEGWVVHAHPEGWIYFHNPNLGVVTEEDLRIPDVYERVRSGCLGLAASEELGSLEIYMATGNSESLFCTYINHQECIASYDSSEVDGRTQPDIYMRTRQQRLYWTYLNRHPSHVKTPTRAQADALDALTWYCVDNIVSAPYSNVPFSKAECEDLLRLLRDPDGIRTNDSPARTVFLSWILREVNAFRVAIDYGLKTRVDFRTLTAPRRAAGEGTSSGLSAGCSAKGVLLGLLMNGLCFGVPWAYLARLNSTREYRGRLNNLHRSWALFIEQLVREYSDFILIATVLLSATISFLALPEIGRASRSAAIISVFASLGSMIVGSFCVWRHRSNTGPSSSYSYIYNAEHNPLGLHGHAILLSLPLVLLAWAIVAFAIAITTYTTQAVFTETRVDWISTWVVLGAALLILVLAILSLYTFALAWKWRTGVRSLLSRLRIWKGRRADHDGLGCY